MSAIEISFKPEAKSVKDIFDGSNYYLVPGYQRAYSWEDEQVEELWDDLFSAFQEQNASYFLGPVILTRSTEDERYYEIIDGQQRLTTLTILFCVLRDQYFKNENKIVNRIKSLEEGRYRLRLITQMHYQSQFEDEILNGVRIPNVKSNKALGGNKFLNAAWILTARLREVADKQTIEKFLDFVLNRVIMITITCSSLSSAIRLFQVINTRGLELSNSDLIKSHLYGLLADSLERSKFEATWTQVDTLAIQAGETLEDLFTYYEFFLLARIPKRSLYEELEIQFKGKVPNEVIYEFKSFVDYFVAISNLQSKAVYALWYLPNQLFWKAIVTTARKIGGPGFDELIKLLRRLYYAYWIAGYTTAKVRQFSFDIIAMLKQGKSLGDIRSETDQRFSDDHTIDRAIQNLEEDAYGQPWLKPLLMLLEYEQTDISKNPFVELDRNVHVDHVLPQEWSSVKEWKQSWTSVDAEKWLNRVGNLALLSGRKNISASNEPFHKKKKIYLGKGQDGITSFLTTQKIIDNEKWTKDEVERRHRWVLDEIIRILDLKIGPLPAKRSFLLLLSTEQSQWDDTIREGGYYHYGDNVPNEARIIEGSRVLFYRKEGGKRQLFGSGILESIRVENKGKRTGKGQPILEKYAKISEYHGYPQSQPLTETLEDELRADPGFNIQYSILAINGDLFERLSRHMQETDFGALDFI